MLKNQIEQGYISKRISPTMKIVLTAMLVALSAVINAFVTLRIGTEFKFSFTLIVYFLAGYVLGAPLGFIVGFAGDLLGWLLFVDGAYNPIIGISNGFLAFIPGIIFGLKRPFKKGITLLSFSIKTVISYLIGFAFCTVFLSSLGIWLYSGYIQGKYETLYAWFIYRAGAQALNTFVNMVLTVIIFIPLKKIKGIKEYL